MFSQRVQSTYIVECRVSILGITTRIWESKVTPKRNYFGADGQVTLLLSLEPPLRIIPEITAQHSGFPDKTWLHGPTSVQLSLPVDTFTSRPSA